MPGITDRSSAPPLIETLRLGHGTLECVDIRKTRRFYEELLGLEVVQTSQRALEIRKGTDHVYVVVETGRTDRNHEWFNHNGVEVDGQEAVDSAHEVICRAREEWGIRKVDQRPRHTHGDYSFYFQDFDGNWWEIVAARKGGYTADFDSESGNDLTGMHEFDGPIANGAKIHTHENQRSERLAEAPEVRRQGNVQ